MIMATIIKRADSLTELPLTTASPQGEAAKRLTIFALLCASTMRQGEALKRLTIFAEKMKAPNFFRQGEDMQRPLQSAEADSFPDGEAGNAG